MRRLIFKGINNYSSDDRSETVLINTPIDSISDVALDYLISSHSSWKLFEKIEVSITDANGKVVATGFWLDEPVVFKFVYVDQKSVRTAFTLSHYRNLVTEHLDKIEDTL